MVAGRERKVQGEEQKSKNYRLESGLLPVIGIFSRSDLAFLKGE